VLAHCGQNRDNLRSNPELKSWAQILVMADFCCEREIFNLFLAQHNKPHYEVWSIDTDKTISDAPCKAVTAENHLTPTASS